jgi:hypothetical protein
MHGEPLTRDQNEASDETPEVAEATVAVLPETEDLAPKSRSLAPLRMVFGAGRARP